MKKEVFEKSMLLEKRGTLIHNRKCSCCGKGAKYVAVDCTYDDEILNVSVVWCGNENCRQNLLEKGSATPNTLFYKISFSELKKMPINSALKKRFEEFLKKSFSFPEDQTLKWLEDKEKEIIPPTKGEQTNLF